MEYETDRWENYKGKAAKVLGGLQLVCGVLLTAASVAGLLVINAKPAIFSTGIALGFFFSLTGAIGIFAGATKKKNHIVANMVLSIISVVAAVAVACAIAYFLALIGVLCLMSNGNCKAWLAISIVIFIFPLIEVGSALGSSIICCMVACCGRSENYMDISMPIHGTGETQPGQQPPADETKPAENP